MAHGSRCAACQSVEWKRKHNPIYDDPRWIRLRRRTLAEHRRTVGPWCPGLPPDHDAHPSFDLTLDHIVPLAQGGAAFDPRNVRVICRAANAARRPTA